MNVTLHDSLDDELIAELRSAVMRLRRRLVNERDPRNELSLSAMAVLAVLTRRGEMTPAQLAAFERVQPPTMTRTVKFLEDEGLVTRRPHESDGRQVLIKVTDAGRAKVAADRSRRDAWLRDHVADLSAAEFQTLRAAAPLLLRLAEEA